MKKVLAIMLIFILTISLFGCQSKKVSYNFEYKFKPEYSDKISSEMAATFIDMTKDVLEIYDALDDFETTKLEEEFSSYAGKVYMAYYEKENDLLPWERKLLEVMFKQWDSVNTMYLLKLNYAKDEVNKSMGIKTEYDDEYYEENFEKLKDYIEESLEDTKKFID